MKKIFILLIISILILGCASIPSGPNEFTPEDIGAVHYNAESLSYQEASYLYVGVGKENFLILTGFDAENYMGAFSVEENVYGGIHSKYIKIKPGTYNLTLTSYEQGFSVGNISYIGTIDLAFDFTAGHVYIYDKKEPEKIDILYWKLGSEEIYTDEIKLNKRSN